MKHTAGPWRTHTDPTGVRQVQAGFRGVAVVPHPDRTEPNEENDANARLIAASPELYSLVRAWLLTDSHGTHSDACRTIISRIEGGHAE